MITFEAATQVIKEDNIVKLAKCNHQMYSQSMGSSRYQVSGPPPQNSSWWDVMFFRTSIWAKDSFVSC